MKRDLRNLEPKVRPGAPYLLWVREEYGDDVFLGGWCEVDRRCSPYRTMQRHAEDRHYDDREGVPHETLVLLHDPETGIVHEQRFELSVSVAAFPFRDGKRTYAGGAAC